MHLTNILTAKAKSKIVMVLLRSTGSNHQIRSFRERSAEKKEIIFFDPYIQRNCTYKEEKKIRGMKYPMQITKTYGEENYGIIPPELLETEKLLAETEIGSKKKSEKIKNTEKTSPTTKKLN